MKLWLKPAVLTLVVVGLIGWIRPATALSATFEFTGTVVAGNPHSLGGIFPVPVLSYPASTIFGTLTFNEDAADANGSPTVGLYSGAIQSLSFSVTKPLTSDAYQFGLDLSGSSGRPVQNAIVINADGVPANQSYGLSASVQNLTPAGPIVDGDQFFAREFFITLVKPSGSVFATDALFDVPPDRTLFSLYHAATNPGGQFRLVFSGGNHGDHTIIGNLASLSVSAVPLPGAVYLFGAGLVGIAAFARRKQQ